MAIDYNLICGVRVGITVHGEQELFSVGDGDDPKWAVAIDFFIISLLIVGF